jgi:HPt (histidine-containing phosphotransfer) domain-containing protein
MASYLKTVKAKQCAQQQRRNREVYMTGSKEEENNGEGAIRVVIDPDLEFLIPQYLQNRKKDMEIITEELQKEHYEPIRIIGHSMKGSGGSYGFERLTCIGSALEESAKALNLEGIRKAVNDFIEYLQKVKVVYGK